VARTLPAPEASGLGPVVSARPVRVPCPSPAVSARLARVPCPNPVQVPVFPVRVPCPSPVQVPDFPARVPCPSPALVFPVLARFRLLASAAHRVASDPFPVRLAHFPAHPV